MDMNLEEFVTKIGAWWVEDKPELIFYARLMLKETNYALVSEVVPVDIARGIFKREHNDGVPDSFNLNGRVEGTLFSMINCYAPNMKSTHFNSDEIINSECSLEIVPAEIVFGGFYANDCTKVESVSVTFDDIEDFFSMRAYEVHQTGLCFASSEPVVTSFNNLSIRFSSSLSHSVFKSSTTYRSKIRTDFVFQESVSISKAREHISTLGMLFSMLKLNHIDISGMELFLFDSNNFDELFQSENRAFYHMNYTVGKIDEIWATPFFRVQYDAIADIYEEMVRKWFVLFSNDTPIIELFYQILIKKSFDVNKFLNLTQALEVFSNKYRKKESKALVSIFPNDNKKLEARLFHKIYDLLLLVNACFSFNDEEIEVISHWIADTSISYIK